MDNRWTVGIDSEIQLKLVLHLIPTITMKTTEKSFRKIHTT